MALLYGLVIFAISYLAAWQSAGKDFYNNSYMNHLTWRSLRSVHQALEEHLSKTGAPPQSLAQLELPAEDLRDSWGRPFHYSVQGTSWSVVSFGREGKPGGGIGDEDFRIPEGTRPEPDEDGDG